MLGMRQPSKFCIWPSSPRLPYIMGTQLDDSRTLADYNIGRNTTLALEKMVHVTIRDSLHPPNCIRLKVTRCPCPPVRTQCHLQLIHNF